MVTNTIGYQSGNERINYNYHYDATIFLAEGVSRAASTAQI